MPIQPFPRPAVLCVPLAYREGSPAAACVEPGQVVEAHERIGRSDAAGSCDVHAPLPGRVSGIIRVDTARRTDIPAVRIEVADVDARDDYLPPNPPAGLAAPSIDTLIAAAAYAGVIDAQPRPTDLASLLRKAADAHVHTLIVNTLAGEPMLTAGAVTVGDHREAVLCAAEWVATALGASRCWLAMDRADRARLKRAKSALRRKRVRIAPLVNRYPQHLPVLLAATITGVETPPGVNPMEAGVLVLQAETLIDLAAAMSWEQHRPAPVTHRVMTVTGPGVVRAGHYRIPIGTRFADVLCQTGVVGQIRRVVEGGSITGRAVDDLNVVVSRETSAMLVLDRGGDHVAAPGPCVQCGWCQEDCPVGLDPQRLLDLAERGDLAAAAGYYPQACIECGLCSYVCPAELPLAPTVMMLKAQVNTAKMRATR